MESAANTDVRLQGRQHTEDNKNDWSSVSDWVKIGQNETALQPYGLGHRIVVKAAERAQAMGNSFIPRGLSGLKASIDNIIKDSSGDIAHILEDLLVFNVPVCDLDLISEDDFKYPKLGQNLYYNDYRYDVENANMVGICLLAIFSRNCAQLPPLEDSKWPYTIDED